MKIFFLVSKLVSPFLLPLGFFLVSFWVLFFLGSRTSRKVWAIWGASFWIFCMPVTANLFLTLWEEPLSSASSLEVSSYDAIVVLGGMVEGLSPEFQWNLGGSVDRLSEAFRLYQKGVAPLILVTGGNTGVLSDNQWTEAQVMADFYLTLGVPAGAILIEDQAQNTYQNALYSQPLLEELGVKKILLVTSAFHMKRSLAIFKKMGLNVNPFCVDSRKVANELPMSLLPSEKAFSSVEMILREIIGYLVYSCMGYL